MIDFALNIQELWRSRRPFVIVTLVDIRGSAPQVLGAKALVTEQGLFRGTVGGGKIEAHCIRFAQNMIAEKSSSAFHRWNLQTDIGMTCGGEVGIFFDACFQKKWPIAIFGAGHISQELCRVLSTWSCSLTVVDPRAEWLEKLADAPNTEKIRMDHPEEMVPRLSESTVVLSMTQGHAVDVPILKAALERDDLPFVGVIGSELKGKKIRAELLQLGVSQERVARLKCPLGLPFGDNSPPEIAVSIAAQLLSIRDQN